MNTPLTDEQIQNWRRAMVSIIGPYELVMSKEEIQLLRDRMQAKANELNDDAARIQPAQGERE